MINVLRVLVWITPIVLVGCAGVNFYSDPDLKSPTGIPIFFSKPYLLVARTGAADKPVEVSIVYLNDPQRVIYADPRSGFGSSNLTLTLTNGQLSTFGQESDTKIPELVNSLAALVTARAASLTARDAPPPPTPLPDTFELYEILQDPKGPRLRRVLP